MKLSDYLNSEKYIILDDNAKNKKEIISHLVLLSKETGQVTDTALFEKNVMLREQISSTGLGYGVAIPHSKDRTVEDLFCVFIRNRKKIDFDAIDDERVDLFFMIGSPPAKATGQYLELLAKVSLFANDDTRREQLRQVGTAAELLEIIREFDKL